VETNAPRDRDALFDPATMDTLIRRLRWATSLPSVRSSGWPVIAPVTMLVLPVRLLTAWLTLR
jgi:hypothetical protein